MVIDAVQFGLVALFGFLSLSVHYSDKYVMYDQKKYRIAGVCFLIIGIAVFFICAALSGVI